MAENLIDLKNKNLKSIINYIRFDKNSTKKDISDRLALSFATVSNMCNTLEQIGLIEYAGAETDHARFVGRSPKYIKLKEDRFTVLSVHLLVSGEVNLVLTDLMNVTIAEKKYFYEDAVDIQAFMGKCKGYYDDFTAENHVDLDNVIGIGVAVSGIYDTVSENIVASEIPLFDNQPVKQYFEAAFEKNVFVDNDANLCAFGAAMFDFENTIYFYIGEGLGIGVIHNGSIFRGERGYGSEICHMPLGALDYKCPLCGSAYCLETDLSYGGFLTKYHRRQTKYEKGLWNDFEKKAKQGEEKALSVIKENSEILGKAVTITANLFMPKKIIIGGISRELFDLMKPEIRKMVNSRRIVASMGEYDLLFDGDYEASIKKGTSETVYQQWVPAV
jgi:predicted NBD/HSP70 family sugar kinase